MWHIDVSKGVLVLAVVVVLWCDKGSDIIFEVSGGNAVGQT